MPITLKTANNQHAKELVRVLENFRAKSEALRKSAENIQKNLKQKKLADERLGFFEVKFLGTMNALDSLVGSIDNSKAGSQIELLEKFEKDLKTFTLMLTSLKKDYQALPRASMNSTLATEFFKFDESLFEGFSRLHTDFKSAYNKWTTSWNNSTNLAREQISNSSQRGRLEKEARDNVQKAKEFWKSPEQRRLHIDNNKRALQDLAALQAKIIHPDTNSGAWSESTTYIEPFFERLELAGINLHALIGIVDMGEFEKQFGDLMTFVNAQLLTLERSQESELRTSARSSVEDMKTRFIDTLTRLADSDEDLVSAATPAKEKDDKEALFTPRDSAREHQYTKRDHLELEDLDDFTLPKNEVVTKPVTPQEADTISDSEPESSNNNRAPHSSPHYLTPAPTTRIDVKSREGVPFQDDKAVSQHRQAFEAAPKTPRSSAKSASELGTQGVVSKHRQSFESKSSELSKSSDKVWSNTNAGRMGSGFKDRAIPPTIVEETVQQRVKGFETPQAPAPKPSISTPNKLDIQAAEKSLADSERHKKSTPRADNASTSATVQQRKAAFDAMARFQKEAEAGTKDKSIKKPIASPPIIDSPAEDSPRTLASAPSTGAYSVIRTSLEAKESKKARNKTKENENENVKSSSTGHEGRDKDDKTAATSVTYTSLDPKQARGPAPQPVDIVHHHTPIIPPVQLERVVRPEFKPRYAIPVSVPQGKSLTFELKKILHDPIYVEDEPDSPDLKGRHEAYDEDKAADSGALIDPKDKLRSEVIQYVQLATAHRTIVEDFVRSKLQMSSIHGLVTPTQVLSLEPSFAQEVESLDHARKIIESARRRALARIHPDSARKGVTTGSAELRNLIEHSAQLLTTIHAPVLQSINRTLLNDIESVIRDTDKPIEEPDPKALVNRASSPVSDYTIPSKTQRRDRSSSTTSIQSEDQFGDFQRADSDDEFGDFVQAPAPRSSSPAPQKDATEQSLEVDTGGATPRPTVAPQDRTKLIDGMPKKQVEVMMPFLKAIEAVYEHEAKNSKPRFLLQSKPAEHHGPFAPIYYGNNVIKVMYNRPRHGVKLTEDRYKTETKNSTMKIEIQDDRLLIKHKSGTGSWAKIEAEMGILVAASMSYDKSSLKFKLRANPTTAGLLYVAQMLYAATITPTEPPILKPDNFSAADMAKVNAHIEAFKKLNPQPLTAPIVRPAPLMREVDSRKAVASRVEEQFAERKREASIRSLTKATTSFTMRDFISADKEKMLDTAAPGILHHFDFNNLVRGTFINEDAAKHMIDLLEKQIKADPNKKFVLPYSGNLQQFNEMIIGYGDGEIDTVLKGGAGQAELFHAITLEIKRRKLEDSIHIAVIPTMQYSATGSKLAVDSKDLDSAFNNLASHLSHGWTGLGVLNAEKEFAIGGPISQSVFNGEIKENTKKTLEAFSKGHLGDHAHHSATPPTIKSPQPEYFEAIDGHNKENRKRHGKR